MRFKLENPSFCEQNDDRNLCAPLKRIVVSGWLLDYNKEQIKSPEFMKQRVIEHMNSSNGKLVWISYYNHLQRSEKCFDAIFYTKSDVKHESEPFCMVFDNFQIGVACFEWIVPAELQESIRVRFQNLSNLGGHFFV